MTEQNDIEKLRAFVTLDRLKKDLETAAEQVADKMEEAKRDAELALVSLGVNSCPVSVPESIVRVTPVGCGYFVTLTDRDGNALDGENLLATLRGLGYLDAPTPRSARPVSVSMASKVYVALKAGRTSEEAAYMLNELHQESLVHTRADSIAVGKLIRELLADIEDNKRELREEEDAGQPEGSRAVDLRSRIESSTRLIRSLEVCYDIKERREIRAVSVERKESASAKASKALNDI